MKRLKLILIIFAISALFINVNLAQMENKSAALTMPGSPVGVAWGFTYGYDHKPEIFMPQLRKLGTGLTKLYLFWQQLEPSKGYYQWAAVDTFIQQLNSPDEALIAIFSSSLWATKIHSGVLPPSKANSPDDYYRFIFDLVKHCKGKIKFWQNDCEPNNPVYWNGSDEEFISQLKVFYRAVKEADPQAQVVIGGYDGLFNPPGMWEFPGQQYGLAFFGKAIKEASAYFDIFDLRLYADPYTIQARVAYFKKQLADSGRNQPIICTEYNGPSFFGFPANMKYVGQVAEWQRVIATGDTAAYLKMKNPLAVMYDSINTLAPQTQMFMMGCPKELNDKYDRLQCRDIVMRNVLAFSAGVQKTMFWDLWHETNDKNDLMTLMFGKNKLLEYDNGQLGKQYPEAEVFNRMAGYLKHIKTIRKVDIADKQLLYLFEIERTDKSTVYIAWEKRDAFSGEDQPATHYNLPWPINKVKAMDTFGKAVPTMVSNNNLSIEISLTPIFIEAQ